MNHPRKVIPRILLGVTADMSLRLMQGFPEFLAEQGWDVHVVSSPGPQLDALRDIDGLTVHPLAMAREPSPVSDLVALCKWIGLLARVKPDLTSVGTPKAGLLGGLASRLMRVHHRIYLLRGLRLETTRGVRRMMLGALERLAINSAHQVIAVSPSLRDRAIELRLVQPGKVVVLGRGSSNGVDIGTFDPAKYTDADRAALARQLNLAEGVPVIGFVGRLTHDKGLNVLAEARALLGRAGIDHQLLVVGGLDNTHDAISLDGENDSVRPAIVTGYVPDPGPYYQVMDLLCLPTLREGFPNVVLEAGASAIPTVTTTATGAIDSVIDGTTGLLATVDSAISLAKQLTVILSDAQRRCDMGQAAARMVEAHFNRRKVWSQLSTYYSDAVAGSSRYGARG